MMPILLLSGAYILRWIWITVPGEGKCPLGASYERTIEGFGNAERSVWSNAWQSHTIGDELEKYKGTLSIIIVLSATT